jgi:hypothetical protein
MDLYGREFVFKGGGARNKLRGASSAWLSRWSVERDICHPSTIWPWCSHFICLGRVLNPGRSEYIKLFSVQKSAWKLKKVVEEGGGEIDSHRASTIISQTYVLCRDLAGRTLSNVKMEVELGVKLSKLFILIFKIYSLQACGVCNQGHK